MKWILWILPGPGWAQGPWSRAKKEILHRGRETQLPRKSALGCTTKLAVEDEEGATGPRTATDGALASGVWHPASLEVPALLLALQGAGTRSLLLPMA